MDYLRKRCLVNPERGPFHHRAPLRVDQATFAKVVHILQLVTVEATGDVDAFATDHNDSLSLEESLGDDGRQTAQQMASPVDHQRLRRKTHCSRMEKQFLNFD